MILVEGDKYACERCINGHRSSTCSHIKRPLVLVRSRGRPYSTQRIAILAEDLEKDQQGNYVMKKSSHDSGDKVKTETNDDNSHINDVKDEDKNENSGGEVKVKIEAQTDEPLDPLNGQACSSGSKNPAGKSCCSSSSQEKGSSCCSSKSMGNSSSVIMLKASKRQVFNVAKGPLKLLQPISDIPNNEVGFELIKKLSAKKRESRHGKSCCSKKKIPIKSTNNYNNNNNNNNTMPTTTATTAINSSPNLNNTNPSISSSSSLTSPPTFANHMANSAASLATSQTSSNEDLKSLSNMTSNMHMSEPRGANTNGISIMNTLTAGRPMVYDMYVAESCTVPGSCCCEDGECSCEGCLVHRPNNTGQHTHSPSVSYQNNSPHFSNGHSVPMNGDAVDYGNNNNNIITSHSNSQSNSSTPYMHSPNNLQEYQNEIANMMLFGQVQMQSFVPAQNNQYSVQQQSQQLQDDDKTRNGHINISNNIPQDVNGIDFNHFTVLSAQNISTNSDILRQNGFDSPQKYTAISLSSSTPNSESSTPASVSGLMEDCLCQPDECACYYCAKHGIVRGVRLADGVIVSNGPEQMQDPNITSNMNMNMPMGIGLGMATNMGMEMNMMRGPQLGSNMHSPHMQQVVQPPSQHQIEFIPQPTQTHMNMNMNIQQPTPHATDIQASANAFLDSLDLSEFNDYCCCPDDACACLNCFKHGRFGDTSIL